MIRSDLNTQAREKTCEETIREYAEAMEDGKRFPPITVFLDIDNDQYILADGFHRLFAHLRAKPNDQIIIEQYLGNVKDALRYAVCANQSHGLKRTYGDKRRAVERYLLELDGVNESDSQISKKVGVVHTTVCRVRKKLELDGRLVQCTSRVGADGRTYNVSNISKTPEPTHICGGCGLYESPRCTIEGVVRAPTDPACETFVPRDEVPGQVEEKESEIGDDSDDDDTKNVRPCVSRLKRGEYIEVPLSRTNTDHAAVQIRHYFDENYLAALAQSAIKLLKAVKEDFALIGGCYDITGDQRS